MKKRYIFAVILAVAVLACLVYAVPQTEIKARIGGGYSGGYSLER